MNPAIETFINNTAARLAEAGIETPRLDVRLLLGSVLGIGSDELRFYPHELKQNQLAEFEALLKQRLQHKPVDKILGRRGFYKYDFRVSTEVLTPRPDTETLVEAATAYAALHTVSSVLDMGTGSGCILLSLLADIEGLSGVGLDVSSAALEIAAANAYDLNCTNRVQWLNASWFDPDLAERLGRKFDIIVSNPPYIPSVEINTLEAEVRDYDPSVALDGGEDGLRDYRQIARIAPGLLTEDGTIFLEAGINQAAEVARIFCLEGFKLLQIIKDFGGIERCVILKK